MALIKCTECGHEVSDKAEMCPNCGCPIREVQKTNRVGNKAKSSRKSWQYIIMGVLAIALLGVGCYFIKSKTLFNNETTLGVSDNLAKAVDGHYAIILYNDNTGELFHPNGGRVTIYSLYKGQNPMKDETAGYENGKETDVSGRLTVGSYFAHALPSTDAWQIHFFRKKNGKNLVE